MSTFRVHLKALCNTGFETALIPQRSGWSGVPIPAKKLNGLPVGDQVFARVPFSVVKPKGRNGPAFLLLRPDDAQERTVEVNATFRVLYLLHTIDRGEIGRKPVAYTLHYADGTCAERVLTVGKDLADWLFPIEAGNCRIGWTGYHPDNEYQKCVYVCEIVNPQPQKTVAAISLKRHDVYGQYMLLAMTLSDEAFFKKTAQGGQAGLADHIRLPSDILRLQDKKLQIEAELFSRQGEAIGKAALSAVINGRRFAFASGDGRYLLSLPKQKGWRQYANTVRIVARKGGQVVAEKEAVFYCDGTPRSLTPPHGHKPPQFIVVAFDDCTKFPGIQYMLDIVEKLHALGARAPLTMYTSPGPYGSADVEKLKLIYKRMYDLGCEFCNHTLQHNPGGVNWYALPEKEQEREITGCRDWFRENIPGLWHVYSQKTGGGGGGGFRDPAFTRDLMRRQEFEYSANNVTAAFDCPVPHPDVQFWPYKLGREWSIDVGLLDASAAPVHRPITKGFFTDYSGKFNYETADGIAMLKANLDYHYHSPNRPPLIINAMHEWGLTGYNWSHRNEKAILEGFLIDVLVKNKKKYPDAHVITFHQLIEYMRRDDLEAIIAEGSAQGKEAR
jgi:peptidoglycan/xylan/chitin deacetylase (PgdA/CDA1 family)